MQNETANFDLTALTIAYATEFEEVAELAAAIDEVRQVTELLDEESCVPYRVFATC